MLDKCFKFNLCFNSVFFIITWNLETYFQRAKCRIRKTFIRQGHASTYAP